MNGSPGKARSPRGANGKRRSGGGGDGGSGGRSSLLLVIKLVSLSVAIIAIAQNMRTLFEKQESVSMTTPYLSSVVDSRYLERQFNQWLDGRGKEMSGGMKPNEPNQNYKEQQRRLDDALQKLEAMQKDHEQSLRLLDEARDKALNEIRNATQNGLRQISNIGASASSTSDSNLLSNNNADKNNDDGDSAENDSAETRAVRRTVLTDPIPGIKDFEHQEKVVIASKIHGHFHWGLLAQTVCLLQKAYNDRVNYDIVVFSTIPLDEKDKDIERIQKMIAPAKFSIVVDNPGLHEQVSSLTDEEQQDVLQRCNTEKIEDLTWDTKCRDPGEDAEVKMSYNWQAEFRSLHLWNHEAVKDYKWMLWIDADCFSTEVWKHDPVATAMRNDMALFFANFPKGRAQGHGFQERFQEAFNQSLCQMRLSPEGHLQPRGGECHRGVRILAVHGFFHVTNLDFMRSAPAMKFFKSFIGNTHFSRKYDDQIAVTVAAGMLAPNRSWDMESVGVDLGIWHNGDIMGKKKRRTEVVKFTKLWQANATRDFPEALSCKVIYNG